MASLLGWYFLAAQSAPTSVLIAATIRCYELPYELLAVVLLYAGFDTLWGRWTLPAVCRRFRDCTTQMREHASCTALKLSKHDLEGIIGVVMQNTIAAKRFFRDRWIAPAGTNMHEFIRQNCGSISEGRRRNDSDAVGVTALNLSARNLVGTHPPLHNIECLIHGFGRKTRKLLNDAFRGIQAVSCHQPRIQPKQIFAWLIEKLDRNLCPTCFYDMLAWSPTLYGLDGSGPARVIPCIPRDAWTIVNEICARITASAPRPYDAKVFPRAFEFCSVERRMSLISDAPPVLVTFFEHLGVLQRIAKHITTTDVDRASPEAEMCKDVLRRVISYMDPKVIALYVVKNLQKFAQKHPQQFLAEMRQKRIELPFEIPVDPGNLGRAKPITAFFQHRMGPSTTPFHHPSGPSRPPQRKRARFADAAAADDVAEEKEDSLSDSDVDFHLPEDADELNSMLGFTL